MSLICFSDSESLHPKAERGAAGPPGTAVPPGPPSGSGVPQQPRRSRSQSDAGAELGELPGAGGQGRERRRVDSDAPSSRLAHARTDARRGGCPRLLRALRHHRGLLGFEPVCVCVLCYQTLAPAGYYIPISLPVVSDKEIHDLAKTSTPTYNVYQTPTAGRDVAGEVPPGRSLRKERSADVTFHRQDPDRPWPRR